MILATLVLLELVGHAPARPITWRAVVALVVGSGYVMGMFLALKWERAGATLGGASVGVLVIAFLRSGMPSVRDPTLAALWGGIVAFVFLLPVLLYLLCWWLERRDRKQYRTGM